jgi:hypothetical protein
MAFLFKSKKNQQTSGLPPATRNVHTSEGAPAGSGATLNGSKDGVVTSQTPTPSGSYNNSLNSVTSTNSPEQQRMRQRAESESQVCTLHYYKPGVHLWTTVRIGICLRILTFIGSTSPTIHVSSLQSRFIPVPVVATSAKLFVAASKPFPAIWRSNQRSGFERG